MGYDGAGNYTRQRNFSGDASANVKILASAMDQEFDDFASAMTLPLLRDGQNSPTADIPMGGFKLTNVGAPASATNYIRAKDYIENVPIYMVDSESSSDRISVSAAYYVTVSAGQAPPGGAQVLIQMGGNKGSVPALFLNGGDGNPYSANVVLNNGSALYSGALVSGGIYHLIFASAASVWHVMNPLVRTVASTDTPGLIEIATTAEATAGTDTQRAMTPALVKLVANVSANTSTAGVVEIATTAEVASGTDAARAVTPAALAGVERFQYRAAAATADPPTYTTVSADSSLGGFSIGADGVYEFWGRLLFSVDENTNIRLFVAYENTPVYGTLSASIDDGRGVIGFSAPTTVLVQSGAIRMIPIHGMILANSATGSASFEWGPSEASASTSTVQRLPGSYIYFHRVS